MDQIKKSCKLGEQLDKEYTEHICAQHSGQVIGFLNEINTNKEHVLKIVERPRTQNFRTKRGLINIVGRVANVLFGVCDDVDADYFHKKIKELEHSRARISQIADTQTQITKSIVTNVNSSLVELESKEKTLLKGYNYLLNEAITERKRVGILEFKQALSQRIALLNIIITQYAYETENLVNIVNAALQGFIHSSLLDTDEFNKQLKEIKLQIPVGSGIPVDLLESGISELLRIININVVYIKGILIFIIEIPLVSSYDFVLYKSIPLPTKIHNNLYAIMQVNSEYVAIDKSRLYYVELNNYQLAKCKSTTNIMICKHEQPIQHVGDSCELMLFRKSKSVPPACNIKYIKFSHNIWHKLDNRNEWIYVTNNESIIITCKNSSDTYTVDVSGTGILSLENNCEANTVDDEIKLIPKREINSKIVKNFSPYLNLSVNFDMLKNLPRENLNYSLFPKENYKIKNNLNKLIQNSRSLDELQNQISQVNENKNGISHDYLFIILILINSIGLILVLIIYNKNTILCRRERTIAKDDNIELSNQCESPSPRLV